ncbi:MAG: sulfatase [Bacillota bacterium]
MKRPLCFIFALLLLLPLANAQDPPPVPLRPPNIILIAIDTVRSDHLGCYGYPHATSPNIDRLAAEGVLFEQCYSVAGWTLPAFMSIFTGLLPAAHNCRDIETALSPTLPTLPEKLHDKGYFCAAVVANPYLSAKFGFGRGFDKYDDYTVFLDAELALLAADKPRQYTQVTDLVTGSTVTQQAQHLLAVARKSGKPLFLFVHYFDPHDSYIPPMPFDRQFDPDYQGSITGRQLPASRNAPPSARDLAHLRALYDGEIAFDDAQLGQFLKTLDATFDPASTLLILLSDHGEAFGEHGSLLHGNSVYRQELQVPMIWRWPGVLPKKHRVKTPVAITDIPATLAALLRIENFNPPHARALWPALTGGQVSEPSDILSDKCLGPTQHIALTRGPLRLHARFDTSPNEPNTRYEFYDLSSDPNEQRNLIATHPPHLVPMKTSLLRLWADCLRLRQTAHPDPAANRVQLNDKERQRLKGLGYTDGAAHN